MKVNRRNSINIELSVRETWILRNLLFDPILRSTVLAEEFYNFAERFHDALKANLIGTEPPDFKGWWETPDTTLPTSKEWLIQQELPCKQSLVLISLSVFGDSFNGVRLISLTPLF